MFEDFQFELPAVPKITALFQIIEACFQNKITSGQLRREARRSILLDMQASNDFRNEVLILKKPSALCASEMADARIMVSGREAIDDCPLRPLEMRDDHLKMHHSCSPLCYFWRLFQVADKGWCLPNMTYKPRRGLKNHAPSDYFGSCSQVSLAKQLDVAGAVEDVPHNELLYVSPMLSVLKNSDLYRASTVGINIVDEKSLLAANAILDPPVKLRVCLDAGANGQNAAQPDFPFSYANLSDAIALMTTDCYMAKLDISNMYLTLGLAKETRKHFGFVNHGMRKRYKRMPFGAKSGAAVLSAFMAEILAIAEFEGVKSVVNYMDDFFVTGLTYAECLANLNIVLAILIRHGWSIADEKTTLPSKVMTFIGIQLDSRTMTLSIEPEKAAAVLFKFRMAREALTTGVLSRSVVYSLAGNCMWFSNVITVGRIYTRPLFEMLKNWNYGNGLLLEKFDKAFSWWEATLLTWSRGSLMKANVRVIPSQLVSEAVFLQQDAGDEGLGYFVALKEENFQHVRWFARTLKDDCVTSSTYKELSTIVWALKNHKEWKNRLVVAVFDSSAAAFGVNNGSSKSPACMDLIEEVYLTCDEQNITIVALWIPRSDNSFADMLTHFCLHNRSSYAEGSFDIC